MNIVILIAFIFVIVSDITCLIIGLHYGSKIANREAIELPSINNPINVIKDVRNDFEANKAQDKFNIELENINSYNGDSLGQKDIPV